jgi:alkylation response protein AidB-like acyl-CoA dehydrogenase
MTSLLQLDEVQREAVARAVEVIKREIEPNAAHIDRTEEFPESTIRGLGKQGLLGIPFPTENGGAGLDLITYCCILEEMGKVCASTASTVDAHTTMVGLSILRFGSDQQRDKYLPRLASGEALGAFALTEPTAGSDVAGIETLAVKDGDRYVLNGTKSLIANANHADVFVVAAKTAPDRGMMGMSVFIIDQGTEGFRPSGKREKTLGVKGTDLGELVFEDAVVPADNLLGRESFGLKVLHETLTTDRITTASIAVGLAEGARGHAVAYAKKREQSGKAISQFQSVKNMIADMEVGIAAARLLVREAATIKENGGDATRAASVAKLFASETAMRVTKDAIQIFGGVGYTQDYPVERLFRDAKYTEIVDGTSEIQRIIIADEVIRRHS